MIHKPVFQVMNKITKLHNFHMGMCKQNSITALFFDIFPHHRYHISFDSSKKSWFDNQFKYLKLKDEMFTNNNVDSKLKCSIFLTITDVNSHQLLFMDSDYQNIYLKEKQLILENTEIDMCGASMTFKLDREETIELFKNVIDDINKFE